MGKQIVADVDEETYRKLDDFRAFLARSTHSPVPVTDATCIAALIQGAHAAMTAHGDVPKAYRRG